MIEFAILKGWLRMQKKNVKTKLMGILNSTPNSFFSPSRFENFTDAIHAGMRFEAEGADWIDIGGESTSRAVYQDHHALNVSQEEEINRVVPLIEALKSRVKIPLSIDTMKPFVASAAIKAGASLINDISGFRDPKMIDVAGEEDCDICVMHMQGTPQTMQQNPHYPEGIIPHLLNWFEEKVNDLVSKGINEKRIILDPGICFGKSIADNFAIIHNLPKLKKIGFPILLGISRKSFMAKTLNKPCEELLPTTLAINTLAIMSEVDIIRVHDVKEHRDLVEILASYSQYAMNQ